MISCSPCAPAAPPAPSAGSVGRGAKGRRGDPDEATARVVWGTVPEAQALLADLVEMYDAGMREPCPSRSRRVTSGD